MKLVIERAALAALLARVVPAVSRRDTIPILGAVRLTAEADTLAAEATNMDRMATDRAAADVSAPGVACVEASRLDDIVKALPAGSQVELELAAGADRLDVRAGRSRFRLAIFPVDDFPVFAPMPAGAAVFDVPAADLRRLFKAVRYAASTEETRFYLCGLYLHIGGDDEPRLRACATDGHRLALASIALPEGAAAMPAVILPTDAADLFLKTLPASGPVGLAVCETAVRLTVGDAAWQTKLIDGTFPDYARVIPQGGKTSATVETADTVAAVKRVMLAVDAENNSRSITFAFAGDEAALGSRGETAEAAETIAASVDGPPVTIGFNARYVLDALAASGGDTADFRLDEAGSPAVVTNPSDPHGLHVVMPMRVR